MRDLYPSCLYVCEGTRALCVYRLACDAAQICTGMQSLASVAIVHGDLAARNVLVFALPRDDPSRICVKVRDGRSRWEWCSTKKEVQRWDRPRVTQRHKCYDGTRPCEQAADLNA